jgi:DNA-binding response OmpR family regulator
MTSQRQLIAPNTKGHECVLLIAADADEAARVLGELGSVTEERFQVEWVTELSRGIERVCDGGVRAAVLDLNLPDSSPSPVRQFLRVENHSAHAWVTGLRSC